MDTPMVKLDRPAVLTPPAPTAVPGERVDEAGPSPRILRFDRTVDRNLVHRLSVAEVFVTDHRPAGPDGYQVAAQLPRSHSYYGDRLSPAAVPDPILLLECCRQAETIGAHEYFGVPQDSKFVLSAWRLSTEPEPETGPESGPGSAGGPGPGPLPLTITVNTANRRLRMGQLQRQEYSMILTSGDRRLARVWMDVAYLAPPLYRRMRSAARGGEPKLSDPGDRQEGDLLSPYRIARRDPANVLLLDVSADPGSYAAGLRIPVANPAMFDHPLDHVPGMVLTEAARQLALLAAFDHTPDLGTAQLSDLSARFERHTELDPPCELRAQHQERPTDRFGRSTPDPAAVQVEAWQDGQVTARFQVAHRIGGHR